MENRLLSNRTGTGVLMIVALLIAAIACGAAPAKDKGKSDAPLAPVTFDPRISLAPLVERVAPAVVNIRTTAEIEVPRMPDFFGPDNLFEWFFGPNQSPHRQRPPMRPERRFSQSSLGSGFIIDGKGLVVTNSHVVADSSEIEVLLSDDRKFKAEVIGIDERTDVALLRLADAEDLPVVAFGDSNKLKVGDHVVAIGNPFGLDHTVTSGIVSAKERVIGAGPYDDFIQTDASINPGNSGGPLFNLKGEVIGINTAIAPLGQGIGFAIPSKLAADVIESLQKGGRVVRGWLGISFQPVEGDLAKAFGLEEDGGTVVTNVIPGSPAEKGGIEAGDVIVELDSTKLSEARQFPSLVASLKPGKKVPVKVLRDRKQKILEIEIGEMPEKTPRVAPQRRVDKGTTELGFEVGELDERMKDRLGAGDVDGVVVTRVAPGSPAAEELRPGDIVAEVGRDKIRNPAEFDAKVKELSKGDDLLLLLYRSGAWRYVVLQLR